MEDKKFVWLIGTCKKGGRVDTRDLCEAGYVPVLFPSTAEAEQAVNPLDTVHLVVLLPSSFGDAERLTAIARNTWPGVGVCAAACTESCRAPGALACALAATASATSPARRPNASEGSAGSTAVEADR